MLLLAQARAMLIDDSTPNVASIPVLRLAKRWIGAVAAVVLVIQTVAYNVRGYSRSA
jgi:hypothetical protein